MSSLNNLAMGECPVLGLELILKSPCLTKSLHLTSFCSLHTVPSGPLICYSSLFHEHSPNLELIIFLLLADCGGLPLCVIASPSASTKDSPLCNSF